VEVRLTRALRRAAKGLAPFGALFALCACFDSGDYKGGGRYGGGGGPAGDAAGGEEPLPSRDAGGNDAQLTPDALLLFDTGAPIVDAGGG